MADARLNFEPAYIANAAGNLFNTTITSLSGPVGFTPGALVAHIDRITVTNTDSVAHTVSLYKGATGGSAGGTQYYFAAQSIPANSAYTYYPAGDRFDAADFLTGVCDSASKCVLTIAGKIYLKSA